MYWARRNGAVRFASEMHAFDPEWQAFVEPFPPGCAWTPEQGLVRFASAVPAAREPVTDREALLTGTRETLVRAVRQQMMGDVNVGVFLSGGLDSSLVAAIASRIANERGRRLQTFAVGTEGSPDLAAARQVAEHLDCEHVEVTYTAAEALESLPNVVRAIESFDPGLVRSAVPNYMLARTTRQHVKVVLTGEGADELFAGYDVHARVHRGRCAARRARAHRALAAQPQPAALRPRDDGPRGRGARAVPRPQRDRLGAADPAGREAGHAREEAPARVVRGLAAGRAAVAHEGRVRRRLRRPRRAHRAVEETVSDAEFEAERGAVEPALRTKEEVAYYRVWREHLQGISAERTLSRFARA